MKNETKKEQILVNGLNHQDISAIFDLITKSNDEQIKALLATLQGELKKRQLQKGC